MPAAISQMSPPIHDHAATDAAIAEFLAGPDADEPSLADGDSGGAVGAEASADDDGTDDQTGQRDSDAGDESDDSGAGADGPAVDGEGSEGEPQQTPEGVDAAALTKAIEAEDPVAFVKALGEHADKLLTGKAHKALRLQVREVEEKTAAATAAQAKADDLATKLGAKYGDPIAARQAAAKGDVNAFLDLVEKWAGYSWNDIQRWVAKGIAGRPEHLAIKAREAASATPAEDPMEKARQEQAHAEVAAWAAKGVKALAPELDFPEAQEMVLAEIREGFSKGINTPAKALPAVRKKLQERYERLHAVFGKSKAPPRRAPSPSVRAQRSEGNGKTRPTTLDEEIKDFLRSEGLK